MVREIAYCRQAAALAGAAPTGHGFPLPNETGEAPMNIVIAGGDTSVDEMVASTERGILVTRLWYIREVDPYEKIFTGMTRDGTFLVEGGKVVAGVRNFRFNVGLMEMLSNVEALSPAVRASGEETFDMVVPGDESARLQLHRSDPVLATANPVSAPRRASARTRCPFRRVARPWRLPAGPSGKARP